MTGESTDPKMDGMYDVLVYLMRLAGPTITRLAYIKAFNKFPDVKP